jgi:hypothetical protein
MLVATLKLRRVSPNICTIYAHETAKLAQKFLKKFPCLTLFVISVQIKQAGLLVCKGEAMSAVIWSIKKLCL